MNTVVLDASVAAKWFLPQEPLVPEALHLLERYVGGQLRFVVPDLLQAEFGNILWKAGRQGRCSPEAGRTIVDEMLARNIPAVSSARLLAEATAIAAAFDRRVYDAIYIALTVSMETFVVTADERLANAVAAHLPVKWLGSL